MNHAIFPGIPVVAIGLALSVELKVYWAMIGHDEQLFRWVWCRKTPASEIQGRTQTPLDVFARKVKKPLQNREVSKEIILVLGLVHQDSPDA